MIDIRNIKRKQCTYFIVLVVENVLLIFHDREYHIHRCNQLNYKTGMIQPKRKYLVGIEAFFIDILP
jgi:hypothetical protein